MDESEVRRRVEEVLMGDTQSFNPIVEAFSPPLYNLACKMLGRGDDAADIVQETFFRAYRDLGKYDGRRPFASWLMGIGVNVCYDAGKRRKRSWEREMPLDEESNPLVSRLAGAEAELLARQREERLRKCLLELPDSLRSAILLRYHEDLPLQSVAEILKIGLSAAKMRVCRGLEMLRGLCEGTSPGGLP
jgi:RNA polymerase sigma-70 factor, ECF subfamily